MIKVYAGVSVCLILALGILFNLYNRQLKESERLRIANITLSDQLSKQNKALKELELDTLKYKENLANLQNHTQNKYKDVQTKIIYKKVDTCNVEEFNTLKENELKALALLKARYE